MIISKIVNKVTVHTTAILAAFMLTSCFSTYPIQKKLPCSETTFQEKLNIVVEAYNSILKPTDLKVAEKGVSLRNNSYEFGDVRFVRVKTKPSFLYLYKRYWIQIREFNGDMNIIYLKDHELAEKTNNALMCLTNLYDTNGRPPGNKAVQPKSKYDELAKLKELLDSRAITQEEYEKEKAKILEQ